MTPLETYLRELINSVEGSCHLMAVAGWLRFVSPNVLITGIALMHLNDEILFFGFIDAATARSAPLPVDPIMWRRLRTRGARMASRIMATAV
jgi:hypothetical protein